MLSWAATLCRLQIKACFDSCAKSAWAINVCRSLKVELWVRQITNNMRSSRHPRIEPPRRFCLAALFSVPNQQKSQLHSRDLNVQFCCAVFIYVEFTWNVRMMQKKRVDSRVSKLTAHEFAAIPRTAQSSSGEGLTGENSRLYNQIASVHTADFFWIEHKVTQ